MAGNVNQIASDFVTLLQTNALEVGEELVSDINAVREYAAQRMGHLATIVHEPGFPEALRAERDNFVLKAALRSVDRADQIDGRILGMVEGAFLVASKALAIVV